ncbi:MAG: arylsulfatase, partial [Planctomycetes bacterium]|nr:arylsulfatase [Planctomycetota bacterium]
MGLGMFSLASLSHVKSDAQIRPTKKPNILIILVDDMGWSDIGCFGGEVKTPNLDRLANGGIRFTQFHNTAKCFPSRACLLTGLYAQQCGMDKKPSYFKNCTTLGEVLRTAGYRTFMTGKHHGLDNPIDRGFDRYFGLRDGACNYFNPGLQRKGEGVPAHKKKMSPRKWCIDGELLQPYTPKEKDFYTTDYFTKYALQYLDEYKDEGKPFFLYVAYNAPHDPLQAWPDDIKKYRGKFMAGYETYRKARYKRQQEMGLIDDSFPLSDPTYADWDSLSDEEKDKEDNRMAVYAAMIDRVDQNIGKLLAKIEERGELDNTLVLFASDNGCAASSDGSYSGYNPTANQGEMGSMTRWTKIGKSWSNISNTPFRLYKSNTHKGGSCTPLIAYWPKGIKVKNRISHEVGHFIDIMPTLAEAAGATYPREFKAQEIPPMQGRSLVPIFQNKKP